MHAPARARMLTRTLTDPRAQNRTEQSSAPHPVPTPALPPQVIIFYSMLANGEMDDFSLHGGCDVLDPNATKWSANFWLWNKPYHFNDAARRKATADMEAEWI